MNSSIRHTAFQLCSVRKLHNLELFTNPHLGLKSYDMSRMGLLVFAVVKLCKYHQQENIRVSMAKERKRLINEDLVTDVSNFLGMFVLHFLSVNAVFKCNNIPAGYQRNIYLSPNILSLAVYSACFPESGRTLNLISGRT